MDAISECEVLVRKENGREEDAPWQLHFRKEMFSPWHDVQFDDVATDLIYRQIIQAVHANEYSLRSVHVSRTISALDKMISCCYDSRSYCVRRTV